MTDMFWIVSSVMCSLYIIQMHCFRVERRSSSDIVTKIDDENCADYSAQWGSPNSCECGGYQKNTFLSVYPEGKAVCGGKEIWTITPSVNINVKLDDNQCKLSSFYMWNINSSTRRGTWDLNVTAFVETFFEIRGKTLVMRAGLVTKEWSGQLLLAKLACRTSNIDVFYKVVGDITYPYDMSKLFSILQTTAKVTTPTTATTPTTPTIPSTPTTPTTPTIPSTPITPTTATILTTLATQKKLTMATALTSLVTAVVMSKKTTTPQTTPAMSTTPNEGPSVSSNRAPLHNLEIILASIALSVLFLTLVVLVICDRRRKRRKTGGKQEQSEGKDYYSSGSSSTPTYDSSPMYLTPIETQTSNTNFYHVPSASVCQDIDNPVYRELTNLRDYTLPNPDYNGDHYTDLVRNRYDTTLSTASSTLGLLQENSYTPLSATLKSEYGKLSPKVSSQVTENAYVDLTRARNETFLSTTSSLSGLIDNTVNDDVLLEDEPSYERLRPIREKFNCNHGDNLELESTESVYRILDEEPVYQGIDNGSYQTEESRRHLDVRPTIHQVNHNLIDEQTTSDVPGENIYHVLES